jgi:ribonuclease P protein component
MQRQFRLREGRDFARMRREGRAYQSQYLRISVLRNGLPHNRYGFITSKQLGNAVTRNRVRRLLRESVRLLHPRLHVGYDVVLVARQPVSQEPFGTFQRIVEELCHQAGLVLVESGGA